MIKNGCEGKDLIFQKKPNLIYKETIINRNAFRGCKFLGNLGYNDTFDIYTPINENNKKKIFLIIKSNDFNSNIDIIDIELNEIIHQLSNGHQNNKTIVMIRHFNDIIKKRDYLLSSTNKEVILWDLNKYDIIYNINSKYNQFSFSSILLFNNYNKLFSNLLIISYSEKYSNLNLFINIYNLDNGQFIKNLPNLNSISCFYILSWIKYENNIYKNTYIIACCNNKVIIYDIYNNTSEKLVYAELKTEEHKIINYYSACLLSSKNKNNINNLDLLYTTSDVGKIFIWDLNNKDLKYKIDTNFEQLNCILNYNENYLLAGDIFGNIYIIDVEQNKIISKIYTKEMFGLICIKKIIHPKYNESLLIYGKSDSIKLYITK